MKGKNYPKKENRKKRMMSNPSTPTASVQDAKYRIEYGKGLKVVFEYLDGPYAGKTAQYDGRTKKWTGVELPPDIKKEIESFFS